MESEKHNKLKQFQTLSSTGPNNQYAAGFKTLMWTVGDIQVRVNAKYSGSEHLCH